MTTIATAVATLGATAQAASLGTIGFTIMNGATPVVGQDITDDGTSTSQTVTFPDLPAGTYTMTVVRKDASGAAVAALVTSDAFTLTGPATITVTIPTAVSVTVS